MRGEREIKYRYLNQENAKSREREIGKYKNK